MEIQPFSKKGKSVILCENGFVMSTKKRKQRALDGTVQYGRIRHKLRLGFSAFRFSEGGSSERIPTWVLWTVEKISNSWNSWTSLWFSFWNLNFAQACSTELRACQYCSVECSILNCTIPWSFTPLWATDHNFFKTQYYQILDRAFDKQCNHLSTHVRNHSLKYYWRRCVLKRQFLNSSF